jgi:hypothetical protein
MRALVTAGCGFLLAVLWFDLMFDVQCRGLHETVLPAEVRDSIAAYYRRVTTMARPMNRLVALAMLVTLGALIAEIVRCDVVRWVAWTSLVLVGGAISLAAIRTVRNAVRLGTQEDDASVQSVLARSILRDHVACFAAVSIALVLQLLAG